MRALASSRSKSAEGKKIARKLVERAVVVDNFLPSQRKRLGLRRSRRAIHCSITGFDPDTPDADTPGYDLLAQAGSGLMAITGEQDGEPTKVGVAVADVLTAHYAAGAICAALYAREKTGRGERIEISLFGATVASLVNVAQNALVTGREPSRRGNAHASIVPYQIFHGSDRPFAIGGGTDRHFEALCRDVIGRPELLRFSTNALRVERREELVPLLEAIFRTKRAQAWVDACRRATIPVALVQGVREALQSESGRVLVVALDHPEAGRYLPTIDQTSSAIEKTSMTAIAATSSTTCFTSPRFAVPNARKANTSSVALLPNTTIQMARTMTIVRWKSGCTSRARYS